jgi:hypothetical protein
MIATHFRTPGWLNAFGLLSLTLLGCTPPPSSDGAAMGEVRGSDGSFTCTYDGYFDADFTGLHSTGEEVGVAPLLLLRTGTLDASGTFTADDTPVQKIAWQSYPYVSVTSTANAIQATIIVPPGYEEAGDTTAVAFTLRCDDWYRNLSSGSGGGTPSFHKMFVVVPDSTGAGVTAADHCGGALEPCCQQTTCNATGSTCDNWSGECSCGTFSLCPSGSG